MPLGYTQMQKDFEDAAKEKELAEEQAKTPDATNTSVGDDEAPNEKGDD